VELIESWVRVRPQVEFINKFTFTGFYRCIAPQQHIFLSLFKDLPADERAATYI